MFLLKTTGTFIKKKFKRSSIQQPMKTLKNTTFLLIILLVTGSMEASSQDATTILENMDNIFFSAKDKQGRVTLILKDKNGKEKIREASIMQKGIDKKLYRYTKPESQAGMATLSLSDDVMWVYMPAFEKPKKISMTSKDQSFTGTDFSLEDMSMTPYASRYTPELLESDSDAFIISLVPKSPKSFYSKIIVRINKLYGYPLTMEYYNLKGKKFKEATYTFEKVGKYWNAAEILMKDLEKDHSTKTLLSDVKYDQGLPDDLFTVENLKPSKTGNNKI
jgi:outer membrane lipoprotein-sorting protein